MPFTELGMIETEERIGLLWYVQGIGRQSLVLDMLYFEIHQRYPNGDIRWIVYIVLNSEDISGIMF